MKQKLLPKHIANNDLPAPHELCGAVSFLNGGHMRQFLDKLYIISGAVAAALIAAICLLVTAQVVMNIITKIGGSSVAMTIPSYASFAGYFLAASSFLALAYTLTRGGHIRVTLALNYMANGKSRFIAEVFSLGLCAACSLFMTYYVIHLVRESYAFGDKSSGMIAVPIWIPQTSVMVGMIILSIALIDLLIRTLINGAPILENNEEM
ncbi:TRAP transporter small permease [Ahrensia sp. 13_GOM-1096m]|uniref:TRAP transporter small permease n=1 Tax=Ahrensia sp. 13_GOM-1096m TaxID=1380380 RepID=UPI00138AF09D|nr:TRAP transporter small permease [Ahrensia sp. 13_GOM-1096m]